MPEGTRVLAQAVWLVLAGAASGPKPTPTPTSLQRETRAYEAAHPTARRIEAGVTEPVEITRVKPEWPPEALARRRNAGILFFQAIVTESGAVEDVQVMCPREPELEAVAIKALKAWRYKPATVNGRPVRVLLTITINICV